MNPKQLSPDGTRAISALHRFVHDCGLERSLIELVKLRASQINGCAHCIEMYAKELLVDGEAQSRLYLLDAWRESPIYSERERAALEWTEAVTLITDGHVSDAVYGSVRRRFTDAELVNLTLRVIAINGANRLNVAFRTVPGSHKPKR